MSADWPFGDLPSAESDLHVGLGYTTRKNAEMCLLARRGNVRRAAKDVREIILSPLREHSRKPEEARQRIERYVGPEISPLSNSSRAQRALAGRHGATKPRSLELQHNESSAGNG